MRYEKGHKENTRKRILATASRRFRKEGIDAVGLAKLMADVGLTHGGFYNHFNSKEDLVAAALGTALDESLQRTARYVKKHGDDLETYVRTYLDPSHRDAPDKGCAVAAAASELVRRSEKTRNVVSQQVASILDIVKAYLPAGLSPEEKENKALAIFSLMVGALQLARIEPDESKSDRILASGITAALAISGNE